MDNESSVVCSVTLEWANNQGAIARKATYKKTTLRLCRNEFRQMILEITPEKLAAIKFPLKNMSVHNKFMNEGKTSMKFQDQKCTVFLANAPPGQLTTFLKLLFVKMTGDRKVATGKVSLREQLLSSQPKALDDISPVTVADLKKMPVSKATSTTPSPMSRKRKLQEGSSPTAKKPFTVSDPLNDEQKQVLQACLAGQNVFFTGSAGTGKSYLLRKIIGALPPDVTTATASTGVAACHIGGITLHQFAGIGAGEATLERSYQMASKPSVASIWRKCKHLIIDEISMVDAEFFEKIEAVARHVRRNDKPFGGLQLILCGDFLQLPPVSKFKEEKKFCFQSKAWAECIQRVFELRIVHRQKDPEFVEILNQIRVGDVTDAVSNRLLATSKQQIEQNGILATRLCSHMRDANLINENKLAELGGEAKTFKAQDSDAYSSRQLDQQTPVPVELVLKLDAQVMLLKNVNIAMGLVNGARGIVVGFRDGLPLVRFRNRKEYLAKPEKWSIKTAGGAVITRKQVPLKLAWAFSIHKSQGLTLDCVEMSLARVFEAGQAYVALSRAQSLDTLRVLDFKASQVWANADVLAFHTRLRERIADEELVSTLIPLGKKSQPMKPGSKSNLSKPKKQLFSSKPIVSIS